MPTHRQDRAGFIESTASEIKRNCGIRDIRLRRNAQRGADEDLQDGYLLRNTIQTAVSTSIKVELCLEVTIGMTCMLTRRTLERSCLRLYD